jgi:Protein of unknown function (DUF2934)
MTAITHSTLNKLARSRGTPLRSPVERRPQPESVWDDEYRTGWIAENAYYRALGRGFEPGHEIEDWLAAERDLELLEQRPRTPVT